MLALSKWKEMNTIVFFVVLVSVSKGVSQYDRFSKCHWNVTEYGCPKYDDDYWKCLRAEARCPKTTEYHCARQDWNRAIFGDGCYRNTTCDKGMEPYILNDWDIKCDWCSDLDRYNSKQQVSSTYSKCEEKKVKCNVPNGIECELESELDKYTKNRLCRCDARENYIMPNFEEIKEGICTSDSFLASRCQPVNPCGENKERLLNYTCADKCIIGYRPKHSDECIPVVSTTNANVKTALPDSDVPAKQTSSSLSSLKTTPLASSSMTFLVPRSTQTETSTSTEISVIDKPKTYKNTAVPWLIVVVVFLVVVVIILFIVIVCIYKRQKEKSQSKDNGQQNGKLISRESDVNTIEDPQDNNASYEVRIWVKKEYDFTAIERARPNLACLEITKKLQMALQREFSRIPEILDIAVKDLRNGSLQVIYIIQTKMSFKKSDLRIHLDKLSHKGAMGEFPIGNIMLIPQSRRDSIIDITEKSVERSERRRSIRRSYSQLSSMLPSSSMISHLSNGIANFPKAEHEELEEEEEPLLEDSGFSSPMKNEVSYISGTPQTPVFTLDSPPVVSPNKSFFLSDNTKDTVDRISSCDKNRSQAAQKRIRRISSSHNDLSLTEKVQQKVKQPMQKHKSEQYLPSDQDTRNAIAREVLTKHYDELLSCLQPDRVLDKFIQIKGFMTEIIVRDIREKNDTSEKNRCIIDLVIKKGYNGYKVLKEVIQSVQLELSNLEKDEMEIAKQYEALETQDEHSDTDSDVAYDKKCDEEVL